LWLVLFLISHLLTNSQAALYIGDDGEGFISSVQSIHHLPYLQAIEIFLLGVPFAVHILFGIHRLVMAQPNSSASDGSTPALGEYPRNKAYTWMRVTSWLLMIGVVAHVIHMRFIEYPWNAERDGQRYYMTVLNVDSGLYTLSERLGVDLYDEKRIDHEALPAPTEPVAINIPKEQGFSLLQGPPSEPFDSNKLSELRSKQDSLEQAHWVEALRRKPVDTHQVVAVSKDFGTASLLIVRDTFKSPFMVALYSLFVLIACYHAFNGLWTFLITWGVTLTEKSQRLALVLSTSLMVLVAFLGLAAAIGTYWINLRY
jgi:succinate dehydrogenase / fumarate reductase cytochrome b subunit